MENQTGGNPRRRRPRAPQGTSPRAQWKLNPSRQGPGLGAGAGAENSPSRLTADLGLARPDQTLAPENRVTLKLWSEPETGSGLDELSGGNANRTRARGASFLWQTPHFSPRLH